MSSRSAPVVVMRWFSGGAGYAHDARVDAPALAAVVTGLGGVFAAPAGHAFRLTLPDGRCLLGEKVADDACLDDHAADRRPSIIRAVLLDPPVGRRLEARARRSLQEMDLPRRPGPHPTGLSVLLPPPIEVPAPEGVPQTLTRYGPWFVAAAVLAFEAWFQTLPDLSGSLMGWLYRAAVVLAAAGAYRLVAPPLPSRKDLNDVERAWAGDGAGDPRDLLADDARLILPDGTSPGASLPAAASDPAYDAVECSPGLAVVRGEEWVTLETRPPTRCLFLRCYRRTRGRWRLALAQWTAAPAGERGTTPADPARKLAARQLAARQDD